MKPDWCLAVYPTKVLHELRYFDLYWCMSKATFYYTWFNAEPISHLHIMTFKL